MALAESRVTTRRSLPVGIFSAVVAVVLVVIAVIWFRFGTPRTSIIWVVMAVVEIVSAILMLRPITFHVVVDEQGVRSEGHSAWSIDRGQIANGGVIVAKHPTLWVRPVRGAALKRSQGYTESTVVPERSYLVPVRRSQAEKLARALAQLGLDAGRRAAPGEINTIGAFKPGSTASRSAEAPAGADSGPQRRQAPIGSEATAVLRRAETAPEEQTVGPAERTTVLPGQAGPASQPTGPTSQLTGPVDSGALPATSAGPAGIAGADAASTTPITSVGSTGPTGAPGATGRAEGTDLTGYPAPDWSAGADASSTNPSAPVVGPGPTGYPAPGLTAAAAGEFRRADPGPAPESGRDTEHGQVPEYAAPSAPETDGAAASEPIGWPPLPRAASTASRSAEELSSYEPVGWPVGARRASPEEDVAWLYEDRGLEDGPRRGSGSYHPRRARSGGLLGEADAAVEDGRPTRPMRAITDEMTREEAFGATAGPSN